jgi:hypothetical protein
VLRRSCLPKRKIGPVFFLFLSFQFSCCFLKIINHPSA